MHLYPSHLLASFFDSAFGRQLDKTDRTKIKQIYESTHLGVLKSVHKVLNTPFTQLLASLPLSAYIPPSFIDDMYDRYNQDGIAGCKQLFSMAVYSKAEPSVLFHYANIHERLHGHKLTMSVLKNAEKTLECTPGQLFSSYTTHSRAWSDRSFYLIEKPHCDAINELCGSSTLAMYLHGNPYRNQKFYAWLIQHQHDPAWYQLQKNVASLQTLLKRIMNDLLSGERDVTRLFRHVFLKNREDVLRLMQPMPLLDQMIDMHPLFEYREHNIRDLFFQEEVSHRGPKHRVYRPDMEAFEAFRTYFIEEAEGLIYEPMAIDDSVDLFF